MIKPGELCPQCAALGKLMYSSIEDYYFRSPGQWDYFQCSDSSCGVVWPNPTPDEHSLTIAYHHYYTHTPKPDGGLAVFFMACLARWKYRISSGNEFNWLTMMPIFGRLLEDSIVSSGAITPLPGGRIVDIGCGSGDRMRLLKEVGWDTVVGVEPDYNAVLAGISVGRNIKQGTADKLPFESRSVDAVVMHHVIEHLRDPTAALAEVFRILKPNGGQLAIITPNIASKMCSRWGRHWRGFEAPRHLVLFTINALRKVLLKNGFKICMARSSSRSAAWINHLSGHAAGYPQKCGSRLGFLWTADRQYREQATDIASGFEIGDEIVMIGIRP